MNPSLSDSSYALGYTDAEHRRLIRQAAELNPLSERLFRDAGIATGHRVLELGSGMGDVSMLVARMVGSTGEVLGIERDPNSIKLAQSRTRNAGLQNISFSQSDITQLQGGRLFDAAVGRFILQFVPDPVAVVRSLVASVRPGGVIAFQEAQWQPYIDLLRPLSLSHACAVAVRDTFRASGVQTDLGLSLHNVFTKAGLPAPSMRMEIVLGAQPGFTTWVCDLLLTLLPKAREHRISLDALGDLNTLSARAHAEVMSAQTVVPWIALVAAWSPVPPSS
jgi:protein-L-isoaspartate O-methyltransferase